MRRAFLPLCIVLLPMLALQGQAQAQQQAPTPPAKVTIYRCTDASGRVALRDTPCADGAQQQVRSMLRPTDRATPPPAEPVATPATATTSVAPAPRVIVVRTPQPMYECVTPDGERYTSDTGDGNPRWVPLWTLGYPALVRQPYFRPGGSSIRIDNGHVSGEFHSGQFGHRVVPTATAYGAGTWIRDTCHSLPQQEVCARLIDSRDAIRTRFFNAMPSERARLDVEERGINARLDSDCGGH